MTNASSYESAARQSFGEKLAAAATARGITPTRERLEALTAKGEELAARRVAGENTGYRDKAANLFVMPPVELPSGKTRSQVHYMPRNAAFPRGATYAQPQNEVARIGLQGIRSFQDYFLLVETGAVSQPDELYGHTNKEMETVAKRLGFTPSLESDNIVADFQTVNERAFAPDTLRLEQALAQRVAAEGAGNAALTVTAQTS